MTVRVGISGWWVGRCVLRTAQERRSSRRVDPATIVGTARR
jgi:hypothetical protein